MLSKLAGLMPGAANAKAHLCPFRLWLACQNKNREICVAWSAVLEGVSLGLELKDAGGNLRYSTPAAWSSAANKIYFADSSGSSFAQDSQEKFALNLSAFWRDSLLAFSCWMV
jgi:hypothetical protein